MSLKHAKTSAKADGADATLVQPSDWNEDHVIDSSGFDIPAGTATPAAPAAGKVRMFGRTIAGRAIPAFEGPSGLSSALQPFFGRNKIGMWSPMGNANVTTGMYFGIAVPSTVGTITARNVATTNLFTSMRRMGMVSATTAGSRAVAYINGAQFWRGNAAGMGGFLAVFRFGCSDAATVAGKSFVGFSAASSVGSSTETSLALNVVGVGTDSTDANLQIMHNDGSGVATKIDLGANFPDHTLSADVYELALFCAPNSTQIEYEVTRLNTGHSASGTITTDLPVSTQLLLPMFMRGNAATALAVGIDVMGLYIETDY